jgi:hypothetical protein
MRLKGLEGYTLSNRKTNEEILTAVQISQVTEFREKQKQIKRTHMLSCNKILKKRHGHITQKNEV